jgi:hypothetical protein
VWKYRVCPILWLDVHWYDGLDELKEKAARKKKNEVVLRIGQPSASMQGAVVTQGSEQNGNSL